MNTFLYGEHDILTIMELFDTAISLLMTVILLFLDNDFEICDFLLLYHLSVLGVDSHFRGVGRCNIVII